MSRESKNLHFAIRFARQFKSEDDANLLIETIRKEIPNVRKADCKFMLGVTCLCLDKEITTGNDIGNMNEIIKFITSDAHVNEYDYNLSGCRVWGCESYCSCDDVRCRAFVRPLTLPCLFLQSAICR